jgi:phage terminase large subunit-like protein
MSRLVFDDGERRGLEEWQVDFARDVFRGPEAAREAWLLVPEGNGKTTFVSGLALYGCDFARNPWIPVGASSRDQARILYNQAKVFVPSTPGSSGASGVSTATARSGRSAHRSGCGLMGRRAGGSWCVPMIRTTTTV